MPEPYWPKKKDFPLSALVESRMLIRVSCAYCKRTHVYRPEDLIYIFGDMDTDSLIGLITCEGGSSHGRMDVKGFMPSGSEAVGLKIRRLVRLEIRRVPIWREG